MVRVLALAVIVLFALALTCAAQNSPRPIRIALLDFGHSPNGRRVADGLAEVMSSNSRPTTNRDDALQVIDRDWARAAALGTGYRGSLNLTLPEARDLGAAIGCDFFFAGAARTDQRSAGDR